MDTKDQNILSDQFIVPDWPLPASVKALVSTRKSTLKGMSLPPYHSFNLATHVDDNPTHVQHNRRLLDHYLPNKPIWLNQIHSSRIIEIDEYSLTKPIEDADGSFSVKKDQVCSVLTADCLPILFCSKDAEIVCAIHVGWRGLALGIINTTVKLLLTKLVAKTAKKTSLASNQLIAWLGPAISKKHFEVGAEVRTQFMKINAQNKIAFTAIGQQKYMADIYSLAKINLRKLGITEIYGGDYCSYNDPERFYSYRRDGVTGRMASLIWKT